MNPASTRSRSLSHLACAGRIAGMWHAVVVRPVSADFRKYERARGGMKS